ncbi:MAG TPA: ribosome maturation factor RimP [Acidimicrobiia bacterium]
MAMDLESIRDAVAPIVASLGLELYDVELTGAGHARAVRVVVDRSGGVDLDTITEATRVLSPMLTAAGTLRDSDVLEVSSPGLERTLRRPEHFRAAVGSLVSVKYLRDGETVRDRGTVANPDDTGFELAPESDAADDSGDTSDTQPVAAGEAHPRIAYADVVACRTVFEWGPAPRPGRGSKPGKGNARRSKDSRPKENSRS